MGSQQSASPGGCGDGGGVPDTPEKLVTEDAGRDSGRGGITEGTDLPEVGKMSKEEALAYCNDLHRQLIDCQLDKSVFSLQSCVRLSSDFWKCMEDARGGSGLQVQGGVPLHDELLPDSVAEASEQFRQKVNTFFDDDGFGQSSTFQRRREAAIRRNMKRNEAHQEEQAE